MPPYIYQVYNEFTVSKARRRFHPFTSITSRTFHYVQVHIKNISSPSSLCLGASVLRMMAAGFLP